MTEVLVLLALLAPMKTSVLFPSLCKSWDVTVITLFNLGEVAVLKFYVACTCLACRDRYSGA